MVPEPRKTSLEREPKTDHETPQNPITVPGPEPALESTAPG
jgi:hypothetical protein